MPNFANLIGTLLQNAAAPSGQARVRHALEDLQASGGRTAGGAGQPGGGLLGNLLGAVQSGIGSAAQNPAKAGGLGALAGAVLGGGGDSIKGAIGGGALAMLAAVAMKGLTQTAEGAPGPLRVSDNPPPGLEPPRTPAEAETLERTANLIVRGMINAAKADGAIDPQEMQRIVDRLNETGTETDARSWVIRELSKPFDLDALVAAIPGPEVAAEVYAASLLVIEVDTPEERIYLQQLAERTGLDPAVVQYIHRSMGVAA